MADLLVRLYDLPAFEATAKVAAAGIEVRRALAPERDVVLDWIRPRFFSGWVAEAAMAMSHLPVTCWIAVKDRKLFGFACHDATARGFFGPTGVDEAARHQGIGEALLIATLSGMREAGYGYAVIGDPGPVEFYKKRLDALEIPGSEPGIYRGMLRADR
jgi:GNAT superfamily N-acetyltransferase